MKKSAILFILLSTVLSTLSFAQSIGLKAGFSLSKIKAASNWYPGLDKMNAEFQPVIGFQFGPTIDLPLSKVLYLESALLFTSSGNHWEHKDADGSVSYESYRRTYNLQIPIVLKAKIRVGEIAIVPSAGAYLGIGLKAYAKNDESKWDLDYGSEIGDLNRLDFGMSFGLGVEYKKYYIGTTYDLGLRDTNAGLAGASRTIVDYNRSLNFSLGYLFGK